MSFFQASPTDAVKLLEISFFLYNNCFVDVNKADRRYSQFKEDVHGWRHKIKELSSLACQYNPNPSSLPGSSSLRVSSPQPVLDSHLASFSKTLDDCDALIQQHSKLDKRPANFIDNVWWGVQVQKRVDDLRKEVQFHSQKICFSLEPILLGRVSTIQEDVAEILVLLQIHVGRLPQVVLPDVAPVLAERFQQATSVNRPPLAQGHLDTFPMKEGLIQYYEHFSHSTVLWIESEKALPDPQEYLNLVKAHWILQTLKFNPQIQAARTGSPLWRLVTEQDRRIDEQYKRCTPSPYQAGDLCDLEDTSFCIWPLPRVEVPRAMRDGNDREEKMLELPLGPQDGVKRHDLIFFRVNERVIRLVRDIEYFDPTFKGKESERLVNVHEDGLIPWYAIAEGTSSPSIEISDSKGAGGLAYSFRSERQALEFQRAITGYAVRYISDHLPLGGVSCAFTWKKKRTISIGSKVLRSTGRIQIWHHAALPPKAANKPRSYSRSGSSTEAPFSMGSGTIHTVLTRAIDASSIVSVQENAGNHGIAYAETIPPPVLVAITKSESDYSIWFVELRDDYKITEEPRDKPRTVIESKSGKIKAHRMKANLDQIGDLNLSAFGWPRHPAFPIGKGSTEVVEALSLSYLAFDFSPRSEGGGFPARNAFNKHFGFAVRTKQTHTQNQFQAEKIFEYGSHRPNLSSPTSPTSHRPRQSSFTPSSFGSGNNTLGYMSSIGSSPPRLGSISISPKLGNSFPWDVVSPFNTQSQQQQQQQPDASPRTRQDSFTKNEDLRP